MPGYCQTADGRRELSLLSNPLSASFLNPSYQQPPTLLPLSMNSAAAPLLPANAVRPYQPPSNDRNRYDQYRNSREFDCRDDRRDSRRDSRDHYSDDRRYDARYDSRYDRDPRYDDRYDRTSRYEP